MSILSLRTGGVAIAVAMALSVPALAQDETNPTDIPRCSATVTDHCMSSGDHGGAMHHKMHRKMHHKMHRKMHHRMHHKMHKMHKDMSAQPDASKKM